MFIAFIKVIMFSYNFLHKNNYYFNINVGINYQKYLVNHFYLFIISTNNFKKIKILCNIIIETIKFKNSFFLLN